MRSLLMAGAMLAMSGVAAAQRAGCEMPPLVIADYLIDVGHPDRIEQGVIGFGVLGTDSSGHPTVTTPLRWTLLHLEPESGHPAMGEWRLQHDDGSVSEVHMDVIDYPNLPEEAMRDVRSALPTICRPTPTS